MTPSILNRFIHVIANIYPFAKRWLHAFHGGVFPKYYKSLSAKQPIHAQIIPPKLILPLQQQVGQPAELLVKVGSHVQKNQLIARSSKDADKALVVPIHAPTSGVIEAIETFTLPHPSGLNDLCVVIKTDQLNSTLDNVLKVSGETPQTPQALKNILLNAGIIGMGGAGFPTYAKIPAEFGKIKTLLINGAECEPFITCDDLLMQTRAEEIVQGALITASALGAQQIICGIESNKPEAILAMQNAALNTHVEIRVVETVYPMGGQKQLTQELTGIEMPHKTHAVDIGLLMMNVATYAAIYRAVTYGEPLTSRLVTVSGLGLQKPFNIEALIGTPFEVLAQAALPKTTLDYPLVMGGPMMGFKVQNNQVPVIKTTNCILVNPPEPVEMQMPCIRCGECMEACPVNLLPQQMYWHSQAHEYDKVEKLNVFDCIECGCCSFVCPSHIPLVQYYRHAKSEIKEIHAQEKAVELAKKRHEFKLARIEREQQEREARLKAKKEAVKQQAQTAENAPASKTASKAPSAAAAAARAAAAKRVAQKATPSADTPTDMSIESIPPARRKAIEAAQKATQKATQDSTSSQTTPADSAAPIDGKTKAKQAAMAAAKARATAKNKAMTSELSVDNDTSADNTTDSTNSAESSIQVNENMSTIDTKTAAKEMAKQAAMAAAKKRALAKQQSAHDNAEQIRSADTPAEQRAAEITDLTQQTEAGLAAKKEAARKAIMQAARASAKRRDAKPSSKPAEAQTTPSIEHEPCTTPKMTADTPSESLATTASETKRQKAMEAARQRAAERKAKKLQETN